MEAVSPRKSRASFFGPKDGVHLRVLTATFDAQDRMLTHGTTRFTYDALGGRTSMTDESGTTTYIHDGLGALLSVRLPSGDVLTYDYDGLQRRVAKRRNGVVVSRWAYEGQTRVVAEVDANGAVISRFVYLPGAHAPEYLVRGGVVYGYVRNHLGSIRAVVNAATGEVAQWLEYDAWGVIEADSRPDLQPFAFAGGIVDSDSGLVHFGFRDFDSRHGVWLSPEPLQRIPTFVRARTLRGLSTAAYAYALSDPLGWVDPDGLDAVNHSNTKCWVKSEAKGWGQLPPGSRYRGNVDGVKCEGGQKLAIHGDNYSITPQPDVVVDTNGEVSCKLRFFYEKPWPSEIEHPDWTVPESPPVLPGTEMAP